MRSPLDSESVVQGGELRAPSWWALAIGIALAGVPLVHFGALSPEDGGHHGTEAAAVVEGAPLSDHASGAGPHMDHTPHHGGQLGMVGDYHIELVERGDTIEVHLSDAERKPLGAVGGSVAFDTGAERPLAPFSNFLLAPTEKGAKEVTVAIELGPATTKPIEMSFLLGH